MNRFIQGLVLMLLAMFAVGCSQNQDDQVTVPELPPAVSIYPNPKPEISPVDPVVQVDPSTALAQAHQEYVDQFGLDVEDVKVAWLAFMGSGVYPNQLELNISNLNKFLQFVRYTGGDEFANKNLSAAAFNQKIYTYLSSSSPNVQELIQLKASIQFQIQHALWLKHRIFNVAKIYGIEIETVSLNPISAQFAHESYGEIAEFYGQNFFGLYGALLDLSLTVSFQVKDSGLMVSFVDFIPRDSVSEDVGFLVNKRVYGAFETKDLKLIDSN